MTNETSTVEQADPLKSVADAMKDAVSQASEDAARAKNASAKSAQTLLIRRRALPTPPHT